MAADPKMRPPPSPEVVAEQEKRLTAQAAKDSIERAGLLTERLIQYGTAHCKEQGLSPEELVFAAALYAINLRETFPPGKTAFDVIAKRAAGYYDSVTE